MEKIIKISDDITVTVEASVQSSEVTKLIQYINQFTQDRDVLVIKDEDGYQLISQEDINSVEVYKDDVTIRTHIQDYVIRGRLYLILEKLNADNFIQVSKSAVININYLKRLENYFSGTMIAELKDGTKISVSRSFVQELKRKLNI